MSCASDAVFLSVSPESSFRAQRRQNELYDNKPVYRSQPRSICRPVFLFSMPQQAHPECPENDFPIHPETAFLYIFNVQIHPLLEGQIIPVRRDLPIAAQARCHIQPLLLIIPILFHLAGLTYAPMCHSINTFEIAISVFIVLLSFFFRGRNPCPFSYYSVLSHQFYHNLPITSIVFLSSRFPFYRCRSVFLFALFNRIFLFYRRPP